MASQEEGQPSTYGGGENQSHPPPPSLINNSNEPPQDCAKGGEEGPQHGSWFPKNIKPAEWVMIAFTAITAVAAWAGVYVANGQLKAMRDSAPDTAKLVQANQDLAKAARTQADNTAKLVDAANRSAGYAQSASAAAQGQLLEMRSEQRPVIDVVGIENTAPLQVDPVIGFFVRFNLVNSGKSPAILTYPHAKLILGLNTDIMKRQKEACRTAFKTEPGNTKVGFNIRAGDTMPIDMGYAMTAEETKAWKSKPDARMYLVGCIDYLFDGRHHHTPFVREVDRSDAAGHQGWMPINPNVDKVDKGGLTFLVPPFYTAEPD